MTILLLIATIVSLPIMAKIFNRRLDGYEIGFDLVLNVMAWVFTSVFEDLRQQRRSRKKRTGHLHRH